MSDHSPSGMPPLGPPYAPPTSAPPRPSYPSGPPNQWTIPPVVPEPGPSTPPPGRGWSSSQRKLFAVVAVTTAAVVLLGLVILDQTDQSGLPTVTPATSIPRTSPSTTPSTTPPTTTTTPQQLDQVIDDITKFVEQQRGLTFKSKVPVKLADENEFAQGLLQDFNKELPVYQETTQVLQAMGLVPAGTDVVSSLRTLLRASVVGYYDPDSKQLVVRGTDATPYTREVIAHELTHALDDQYFNLNRPELDTADDETSFGFTALTEGDAKRVEDAYVDAMSPSDRSETLVEQAKLSFEHPEILTIDPFLATLIAEPYEDGPNLVKAILANGGQPRLDQSFATPPTTSEQVIDPNKFLAGEGAVPVDTPKADADQQNNVGVVGAYLWQQAFANGLPSDEASRAITGWGGDRYITWQAGGQTCLRDTVVGDTPTDTDEFAQALKDWAIDHDAQVDAPSGAPVTVTVCA